MAANPLIDRLPQNRGRVTTEMLHDYADHLNTLGWVRASGKPYHVGVRVNSDGKTEHFLDRRA